MKSSSQDIAGEQEPASIVQISGWSDRTSVRRVLLPVAGTFLVFYLLFHRIDLIQVLNLLTGIAWPIWIISASITLSFPLFSAVRWKAILSTMDHEIPFVRALLIIVGIWPISSVSPSKSGDLLKAYSLRRDMKPVVVIGSVLIERAFDLLVLSTLAMVGGIYFQEYRITIVAIMVLIALITCILLVRLNISLPIGRKFQSQLRDLNISLNSLWHKPRVTLLILFFTMVNWFASVLQTQILFRGVGVEVSLGFTAAALPIAILAGLFPISIGGMGTRDTAIVILFAAQASASQALAVGLLYSFFGYWMLAILGLPLMRRALGAGR